MSDQTPPPAKPKPGSLRDRIAAFENKGGTATTASPPAPPAVRPKPGNVQWKPRPPSPPTPSDAAPSAERKPVSTGGMSASDAMESIGRGGSLKERMAALQGKGGFGAAASPPPVASKPNVERPKWKPPPAVPAPVSSQDEVKEGIASVDVGGREASRSPPPHAAVSPTPGNQGASNQEGDTTAHEGDGEDPDPEDEERQRRAAIAARMARLGGARLGMGPPIFAPKPVVRKSEPAPEAQEGGHADQLAVAEESNEALVSPPLHDVASATSPTPEAVAGTDRNDEHEASPPVPTRAPVTMPVPAGPRRAAPPRKKVSKNAPATALPEPPVEEAESVVAQRPPIVDEHTAIGRAAEASNNEYLNITADVEERPVSPPAPIEAFHEPVEEPKKQEAEEEFVEGADSRVEEDLVHTTADDQQVPSDQAPEAAVEEGGEEARRQRVAAKLTQMGALNPLAGLVPVPLRQSFDEQGPVASEESLDVNVKANVDTEEYAEATLPPAVPAKHDEVEPYIETDQGNVKVDEDDQVPAHRDGERAATSYTEEQDDGQGIPESSEQPPIELGRAVTEQEQGTASAQRMEAFEAPGTASLGADDLLMRSTTAEVGREPKENEIPPPRIARPPPPPPVNFQSKPKSPPPPPLSPPPKALLQALRADEEERPASPDMPPRPVPPPGRSSSMMETPSPRRSMPPPPRPSTSIRVTDPLASPPSSPPRGRPITPPIITTLAVQEQAASEEHDNELVTEEPSEMETPQPEVQGDEASARRRAIADRMARLGGIRFGPLPQMSPLSRPPLPAAPPPTSIPPDETESEGKEESEPREGEEEDEAARKQRIAAKLAGMGGMRFGMLPLSVGVPPASTGRFASTQEDSEGEDAVPPVPVPAPLQRPPPTRKLPPPIEPSVEQESEQVGGESHGTSDDGVHVEAEESDMEEVHYSDAEALPPPRRSTTQARRSREVLPTPPPRVTSRSPPPGRPPIPMIPATLLGRRPSATAGSTSSSRKTSMEEETSPGETPTMSGRASQSGMRPQSEYVMVEAEYPDEDELPVSPPPHRKSMRGPGRSIPSLPPVPPPSAIDPPEALTGSVQWELPSIPQGVEFGEGSELALSSWSEDSTAVHVPPPIVSSPPGSRRSSSKIVAPSSMSGSSTGFVTGSSSGSALGRRSLEQQEQLTTDELMTIWGKVGVQVVEAATTLFEKSKRALVGDGSYAGFVRAVLAQVPGAVYPGPGDPAGSEDGWGYVVYAQTGNAVQRRISDILPGDVIAFYDAKLKGHKGLHTYVQTVGAGESGPLMGIVSEFEVKKSKVRVWQANQHVGQQTVENVSYRLEDLKSGQAKVFRVLHA